MRDMREAIELDRFPAFVKGFFDAREPAKPVLAKAAGAKG
jgi:queuine/archaeosine tRNA-ribosyltransferase